MQLDRITDWLWCLRTPLVNAYAVRERDGFNLIDASRAGEERAILGLLGELEGQAPSRVRVHDILLTHGHDDHTGSAGSTRPASWPLPGTRAVTSRCGSSAIGCSWPATRWPATTDGRWSACSTQTRQAPPRARSTLATLDVDVTCFGHGEPVPALDLILGREQT
jgi:mRNA degradation ribonuclease J1/J2